MTKSFKEVLYLSQSQANNIWSSPHTRATIYLLLLILMLWHRQAIFKSKGDKLCSSAESRIWTRGPRHQIASRLNARWQTDWAIEDQAKTWTRQPVPMLSEHSAHLTPLSVDFRTWLWRYTYLLLLIHWWFIDGLNYFTDKSDFGVLVWRKHVYYSFIRKKINL